MITLIPHSPLIAPSPAVPPPSLLVKCSLSDEIAEAVTAPANSHTRSEVIYSLVREIYESMAWHHGAHTPPDQELLSLHRVLAEADAHQARMHWTCNCHQSGAKATA